jgi:hypothetical protein
MMLTALTGAFVLTAPGIAVALFAQQARTHHILVMDQGKDGCLTGTFAQTERLLAEGNNFPSSFRRHR